MREVGAEEAESRMGQLLEWVEAGEAIVITRSGKAIARLLPVAPAVDTAEVREAIAGISFMGSPSVGGSLGFSALPPTTIRHPGSAWIA